jgi:outer membrane immunogenic protein
MNTKKTVVAAVLACGVGMAVPGIAAAAGTGDWTGFYIGGHAGYGVDNGVTLAYTNGNSSGSFDMKGYTVGLQGGHNWAVGGVVVGVEADASYADINGDALCPNPSWICSAKMDQLITVRARVGMPVNNFLLYGTIGVASGEVRAMTSNAGVEYPGSRRDTGWGGGLGGEMAFTKNLSGRVEVLYVNLGSNDYVVDGGNIVSVETKVTTLRVGANWRF